MLGVKEINLFLYLTISTNNVILRKYYSCYFKIITHMNIKNESEEKLKAMSLNFSKRRN